MSRAISKGPSGGVGSSALWWGIGTNLLRIAIQQFLHTTCFDFKKNNWYFEVKKWYGGVGHAA